MSNGLGGRVLEKMLERLFASVIGGPAMNCRPHASRQRVDFLHLNRLGDVGAEAALGALLSEARQAEVAGRVKMPPRREAKEGEELSAQERAAQAAWADQHTLLNKLRVIADEARTYEQDTGVQVLAVGFPLLVLPPGASGLRGFSRRVAAPLAFVPVSVSVSRGTTPVVRVECLGDGVDLVRPNEALLAWVEQQTGKEAGELFADEAGTDPWKEIASIVRGVAKMLGLKVPALFAAKDEAPAGQIGEPAGARPELKLVAAPRADDDAASGIVLSAVLGLFPAANQGLLRDMKAMAGGETLTGPVESFVRRDVSIEPAKPEAAGEPAVEKRARRFADERLVSAADPCQARAVRLARECSGLVIHGPPGTGKSQTITNVIGDHLARGQRVLLVCDKRTALDVVANRLTHLGLSELCAIVHDPQRDQRELYKGLREQLDALAERTTNSRAESRVGVIDAELQATHDELTRYWQALMRPADGASAGAAGQSFHELMGQWMELEAPDVRLDERTLGAVRLDEAEQEETLVREILSRGQGAGYRDNPWVKAAGGSVGEYVARPMGEVREAARRLAEAGAAADATGDERIPALAEGDLRAQGAARGALATTLEAAMASASPTARARWSAAEDSALSRARAGLGELAAHVAANKAGALEAELSLLVRESMPTLAGLTRDLATLRDYADASAKWYRMVLFGPMRAGREVLRRYGVEATREGAQRLIAFLTGLKSRLVLTAFVREVLAPEVAGPVAADTVLVETVAEHAVVLGLLEEASAAIHGGAGRAGTVYARLKRAISDEAAARDLVEGLKRSAARADALVAFEAAARESKLLDGAYLTPLLAQARGGGKLGELCGTMFERVDGIEAVLRVREGLARLRPGLRGAAQVLVASAVAPDEGLAAIRKAVLAGEITRRLREDPQLQGVDGHRLGQLFARYRELDGQKKELVRDAALHLWVSRQRGRLLASTGSRLNSLGADMKRRLTLRGEKAMRLRQVVKVGGEIEGGDPLFDLRPVWMASPETVAQVLPRAALFDVVVFDEASQCRLEEALPVLTRAKRVVIAGDPRQLPPTRFFESAVAQSEMEEAETDQELFESQQSEVEDLLGAALNLDIEECYLDVHYRSRNADLIGFSNEHFYHSRLQVIPGHPANRTKYAPLTVYRADGVYDKRVNEAEATRVCQIVRDLLRRAEPPSIGIASFNLQQRDLIVERLEEMASQDADFAGALAAARTRTGAATFEGLFVKNLENVQGDERDHIIISTTYGPDPSGRFYRRFGPLGRSGGGRRLNVLVTRARMEVHVVTSIPKEAYAALPPVPEGQTPTGAYLLFAYLQYAEVLAQVYGAEAHEEQPAAERGPGVADVRPTRTPSAFSAALAQRIAGRHGLSSTVHWGNDGFAVDVALHHPTHPEDVTIGLLCDATRFAQAADPVEWDIFRTAVHESQGWTLRRIWTPHFFRDPEGQVKELLSQADAVARSADDPQGIRTQKL